MTDRLFYRVAAVTGLLVVGLITLQLFRNGWLTNLYDNGMDPTTHTFAVRLFNDSNATITLKQCDPRCAAFHDERQLLAGDSMTANTTDQNVNNYWMVVSDSGTRLGCLNLKYDHKALGAVVNASMAGSCP